MRHLQPEDLLKLAGQVCRNVRPAWRDDFTQRLAILSLNWANGYTRNQVRRYMVLRLREFFRETYRRTQHQIYIQEIHSQIPFPIPNGSDPEQLTAIYAAARTLSPKQKLFLAEWFDELLSRKVGAISRSIQVASVAKGTADRAMKGFRAAYKARTPCPKGIVPVKNISDLLRRIRASGRRSLGKADAVP